MTPLTSYLPSKKFIAIVGIIFILGGIAYGLSRFRTAPVAETNLASVHVVPSDYDSSADPDGDGLANWEEALWGTNPNSTDTDGDGSADNIELKTQRNPLISANDDSLSIYPAIPSLESADTGYAGRTSGIAQAFTSQLYAMGTSGGDITGKASIINDLLKNEIGQGKLSDEYTAENITIVPDNDDNLRAYGNAYGGIIRAYESLGGPYETPIITNAFSSGELSQLLSLERFVLFFNTSRDTLLTTKVPKSFADAHLNLINGINNMSRSLSLIEKSQQDSFMGLLGLSEYRTALTRIDDATLVFVTIYTKNKTVFSSEESGFMFINR